MNCNSNFSRAPATSGRESHAAGCRSGAGVFTVGSEIRWANAIPELQAPRVPFPSLRIFQVAGEQALRALVLCHHQRLSQSALRGLFPADQEDFLAGVTRAADYVVETCGGPNYFTARHGKPCMRRRHYPFAIDEQARDIWLHHLYLAFDDAGIPVEVRQEYWDWAEAFSIRMINRRTERAPLRRYPFADFLRSRSEGAARPRECTQAQAPPASPARNTADPKAMAPDYAPALPR
jgi:hemoglobin